MAYPPLRSMNENLRQGAYMDGKIKQLRPDAYACEPDATINYADKRALSLPYYGFGQPRVANVPGTNQTVPTSDFVPNKFETEEDRMVFGKTW